MNVTPMAIEKLKEVMTDEDEAGSALRVVAMPAGHGLQYMLTMEKEHQPDDTVLRMDGMEFLMDSDSAPFLEEATIDYVEEFGGPGRVRHQQPHVRRRRMRQRWLRLWRWRMWLRRRWLRLRRTLDHCDLRQSPVRPGLPTIESIAPALPAAGAFAYEPGQMKARQSLITATRAVE